MKTIRRAPPPFVAALQVLAPALAIAAMACLVACGPAAPAWDASASRAAAPSSAAAAGHEVTPAAAPAASSSVEGDDGGRASGADLTAVPPDERAAVAAVLQRIAAGGPFPHQRDGIVFGNRERLLPSAPRGYYHEYTVDTPGAADRGARRIVSGESGEAYFSNDHYRSFLPLRGAPRRR